MRERGVAGHDMDAIVVTHEHSDHIKGLGAFARKYECADLCECKRPGVRLSVMSGRSQREAGHYGDWRGYLIRHR